MVYSLDRSFSKHWWGGIEGVRKKMKGKDGGTCALYILNPEGSDITIAPLYPELLKPKGSVPRSGRSGTTGQDFRQRNWEVTKIRN